MASSNPSGKQLENRTVIISQKDIQEANRQNAASNQNFQRKGSVRLSDILRQERMAQLPERPVPKRKPFSSTTEDSEVQYGNTNPEIDISQLRSKPTSNIQTQVGQNDVKYQVDNRTRPTVSATSGYNGSRGYEEQKSEDQALKEKHADTNIFQKFLQKKSTPRGENRYKISPTPPEPPVRSPKKGLQVSLKSAEEGVGPLHITETRPVHAELIDETKVEIRPRKRLDSVGKDYLKDIERQLEIIEQGQLATLHLDPADDDPMFAAAIPRPQMYAAEDSDDNAEVFRRGEPVRSSAGGVIGTSSKLRGRPRTGSDNAGPLTQNDRVPTRTGFGRTPVRHIKSPITSPDTRRAPVSDEVKSIRNSKKQQV